MSSFLVIGEALVDVVVQPDGQRREHVGGSPLNVAVGLARLGNDTELLARIGTDHYGTLIERHLQESGVRLDPACVDGLPTSTAVAQLDAEGRASYTFDLEWVLPQTPAYQGLSCVHLGSIGAFLEPGASAAIALTSSLRNEATVSFDPNIRTEFTGEVDSARKRVESIVAFSDVVKVSEEDLAWLTPGEDPVDVAAAWLGLGPALVVVTHGGASVHAVTRQGRVQVAAERVQVVDTVGAGDAFTTGLLDALGREGFLGSPNRRSLQEIGEGELAEALRFASHVAAITCSRPGADPPWRGEL